MKSSFIKFVSVLVAAIVITAIGYYKFGPAHHTQPAARSTSSASKPADRTPKSTPAKPVEHIDAALQQLVDNWVAAHSFSSAVAVTELGGDLRTANHNIDGAMTTASTYKLYVAYGVLHQIEQGTYTLSTKTRTGQTVDQALQKMILQSDNASAEAIGFLVGWDTINSLASSIGATHTDINNYDSSGNPTVGNKQSTASDLALLVTKLEKGTLLNAGHTQLLLDLMKNQVWRERIPKGVPSIVVVADKPGWLPTVQNDAAIVYGPKSTYTLIVMTSGSGTPPLADLSRQVYDYLQT